MTAPQGSTAVHPHDSTPVSCCPPYAKVPSGELISEDFLTACLPGVGAKVSSLRVDEASLLVGRHSTTFRLLLDWSPRSTDAASERAPSADGSKAAVAGDQGSSSSSSSSGGGGGGDPIGSVFVKRMTCKELPARTLIKWRTSISSYRAEATFFKTVASSKALGAIVPHAFWVHVDDRLGEEGATGGATAAAVDGTGGDGKQQDDEGVIKALQESCFMMITEDLGADWEQAVALDLDRAKAVYSAVAHLHASFWPSPSESAASTPPLPPPPAAAEVAAAGSAAGEREKPEQQQQQQPPQDPNLSPDGGKAATAGGGGGGRRRYAPGLHDQGTFWNLEKRNPEDLEGLEQEYENLLRRFRPLLPASWFDRDRTGGGGGGGGGGLSGSGAASLGRRLASRALDLDAAVLGREGGPPLSRGGGAERAAGGGGGYGGYGGRRGRTLVHGDLKTWNVFFRKGAWGGAGEDGAGAAEDEEEEAPEAPVGGKVKIIDWQWCGEGLAAADVAYVMCTSLESGVLLSKERELLGHYHAELSRGLEARFGKPPPPPSPEEGGGGGGGGSPSPSWYPVEQLEDDYRVAFLDYMRCVVGTLWKGLTPQKMEKNLSSGPGLSLINRSIQHMQWMIERATRLLDELDNLEENK